MQIKTQRLTLEPLGTKFLVSTHAYASDPELTRLMVFLPTDDLAETERYLKKCEAEAAKERPQFYETAVLLDGIKPYFMKYVFHAASNVTFALASLGNDAGAYGAFKLAVDAFAK